MPESRLAKARATLPMWYRFGDAKLMPLSWNDEARMMARNWGMMEVREGIRIAEQSHVQGELHGRS